MSTMNRKFKHQRSSMKVNLSCTSSLTDSDNNSLGDTPIRRSTNNTASYVPPLKNLRIVLERINRDNATLAKNSETLKNIILTKTMEIFDEQDELSLKTRNILSAKIDLPNILARSNTECSDVTNKIQCNNGKHNLCQSIGHTSNDKCKNKSTNEQTGQSRRTRRQLFNLRQHLNDRKATANDTSLKCQGPKQNLLQLKSANEMNSHGINSSNVCGDKSGCTLDISTDESSFITAEPIWCSTMISDRVSDIVQETCSQNEGNVPRNFDRYTRKVCRPFCQTPNKTLNYESINVADPITLNTSPTSLNVNTSIDVVGESRKSIYNHKWINCQKRKHKNIEEKQEGVCSVISEGVYEDVNTICTSLQMNTSLGTSNGPKNSNITKVGDGVISYNKKNSFENSKPQPQAVICLGEIVNDSHSKMIHEAAIPSNSSVDKIDTSGSDKNQNVSSFGACPDKRKRRKKLLPLHECSQPVSFSPVQNDCSPPRYKIFRRTQKSKKNKCNKKNNNNVKNLQDSIRYDERKKNKDISQEKQKRKPRKIISKKIVVKKIVNEDILRRLEANNDNINKIVVDVCAPKRKSSNDFEPLKRSSVVQIPRKETQRINIVVTGYSNEDKNVVKKVVKVLGFANIESRVTKHTTHVVTTGVRTVNLLHGIIRGCWLVSLEWIFKSLESNTWINPETYEMVHFSKAVLENRKDRQLFGKSYVPELFAACGCIYVGASTTPPRNILKDLIKAAGGSITENQENAKILIGQEGLKETWILDCITSGELQPFSHYQRP